MPLKTKLELLERHYVSTDWITLSLMLGLVFLVLARLLFPQRFEHFVKLVYSDRYFQQDRGETPLLGTFTLLLSAANVVFASLFIYLVLSFFGVFGNLNPKKLFIQILVIYTLFISFKYYLEKILGELFKMEKTIGQHLFSKISLRNYLSFWLLPVVILFVYAFEQTRFMFWAAIGVFMLLNFVFLVGFYRKKRKLISENWFYFILYLCALEIAPYFILFKAFETV